jgi:hypothetical protein
MRRQTNLWMNPAANKSFSRHRRAVAIVAILCLLAAVGGCWLLRVEGAKPVAHPPSAVAISKIHNASGHFDCAGAPTNKAPMKSAGMRRGRPPVQPRLATPGTLPLIPIALRSSHFDSLTDRARAPVATFAQCDLLTRLCIDRR